MAITINGSGTITGISAGGLPDNCVTAADLATTLDLSSNTVTLPSGTGGKILQVASSTKTNTTSTSSTTPTNITNMSASFGSLASTSSKVYILVSLNLSQQQWQYRIHLRITGGNAASYIGDANTGVESAVTVTPRVADSYAQLPVIMSYLDSPSTTSSVTYQVQWWVEANTAYLNRPYSLDVYGGNCASTITIMEVGA